MINNGIISIGDNNNIQMSQNTFDMILLKKELKILLEQSEDKVFIQKAIQGIEEQNETKVIENLKKLGKESYRWIKDLSLNVLSAYLAYILTK